MSDIKRGKFCHNCARDTLHLTAIPSHLIHCILSILTLGIWLPIWAWAIIWPSTYRCSQCGTVYSWRRARKVKQSFKR